MKIKYKIEYEIEFDKKAIVYTGDSIEFISYIKSISESFLQSRYEDREKLTLISNEYEILQSGKVGEGI